MYVDINMIHSQYIGNIRQHRIASGPISASDDPGHRVDRSTRRAQGGEGLVKIEIRVETHVEVVSQGSRL